ncbi:MAG: YlqD family protein [Selenomonadaceae bacterium]|nr:YlqD family protein [Selenomonadaceae bacterium]
MDSISIKVPVTVKAKLTEKLKDRLINDFSKTAEQMELEIRQIEIDRKRELDNNPENAARIQQFFGNEINQRRQRIAEANLRKETIEKLTIGAEITQGTLERQVELKIGDNMREIMNVEILIEDDKIIAIRG